MRGFESESEECMYGMARAVCVLATAKGFCRTISGKLSIKTPIFYGQAAPLTLCSGLHNFLTGTFDLRF